MWMEFSSQYSILNMDWVLFQCLGATPPILPQNSWPSFILAVPRRTLPKARMEELSATHFAASLLWTLSPVQVQCLTSPSSSLREQTGIGCQYCSWLLENAHIMENLWGTKKHLCWEHKRFQNKHGFLALWSQPLWWTLLFFLPSLTPHFLLPSFLSPFLLHPFPLLCLLSLLSLVYSSFFLPPFPPLFPPFDLIFLSLNWVQ